MDSFPIFMRLQGRKVLVVGAGEPAHAKQRLLAAAGAVVDWVASLPSSLDGYALIFGATGDDAVDRAVAAAARAAGRPVNVVDRPDLSDFIMPAVVDRGDVVIGISTGGASPILAQRVRGWIEDALPARLDRLAAFARHFRAAVQNRLGDSATRRRFWGRFFDGRAADLVLAGSEHQAARQMIQDLNGVKAGERPTGSLTVIALASGGADELRLKDLRALRRADVIAHDGDIPAEILGYARREARRIATHEVAEIAGLNVVVLHAPAQTHQFREAAR
jgi:uroporphyrin-III C-methyltransferase/precorrin-2 dehydrogenase/sirohydrochlorin ferrochelatase